MVEPNVKNSVKMSTILLLRKNLLGTKNSLEPCSIFASSEKAQIIDANLVQLNFFIFYAR